MSRKIAPKASVSLTDTESALMNEHGAKLIFTTYQNRRCGLIIRNSRLIDASFFLESSSKIGAIYIGKVKSLVKNLNACFVEIADGEVCFLSMKNAENPYLVNRTFDGRILEGDELLVQVIRDAQKGKRSCVSAEISLSNDCFALMLGTTKVGFSSKLDNQRKGTLKKMLSQNHLVENGNLIQDCTKLLSEAEYQYLTSKGPALEHFTLPPVGMIVRTMAGELTEELSPREELLGHFYELSAELIRLLYFARFRSCFSCLKQAPLEYEEMLNQFVMDEARSGNVYPVTPVTSGLWSDKPAPNSYNGEVITDNKEFYEHLTAYCASNEKFQKINIRFYQDDQMPLSILYSIEKKMETALANRVWLKSGGNLVIETTEALTVIDVNTGKCEVKKGSEEVYYKINLEAACEIALQLRLRNLSGIIIVDFISMESAADEKELLAYLRTLVKYDKVQTTIVDITPLGLVEITRKKRNKSLREQFLAKE